MRQMHVITALVAMLAAGASTQAYAQGRGRGHEDEHGRGDEHGHQVSAQEQQRRIQEEQQRAMQYRQHYDQQVQAIQQRNAELQAQAQRAAQYRAQQDYERRLQEQRAEVQRERDYQHDAYMSAPLTYRYVIRGTPRETNQYGVDLLRRAVNYGYQQGYSAGRADRQDHWRFSYQSNPAYQDANYGYTGAYIDQPDYNYYFRQGFQRGYEDGYYSRLRYGNLTNGSASILGNILNGILGLATIH